MKRKGVTLLEVIAVLALLMLLAALLAPQIGAAKRRANEAACWVKLTKIHGALALYAQEYGGLGRYGDAGFVGLPPVAAFGPLCRDYNLTRDTFQCTGISWQGSGNRPVYFFMWENEDWGKYCETMREEAILAGDLNHNPPSHTVLSPYLRHRGIGLYLSGHLRVVQREGMPFRNEWWNP